MNKVKVLILRSAGTNCDKETALAFKLAGADAVDLIHINQLIRKEKKLYEYNILAIPGGFSYGDDISAGKVFANELKYKLWDDITRFIYENKLIIGICNGFQVLVKTGLIEDATLSLNDSAKFECRWVHLQVEQSVIKNPVNKIWVKNLPEIIQLPVAHGEGKFIPLSEMELQRMNITGQVVFRYTVPEGWEDYKKQVPYPYNPNGAVDNIAGITNQQGNILGMMPHPERHIFGYQNPFWTKNKKDIPGMGLQIFINAVSYAKKSL